MKVAPLITVALILCIAFLGPIQAKKKPKPKFCIGKNGIEYAVGDGYVDKEGEVCIRYRCFKKKKKVFMKENKCIDGEWSDWSSWSAYTATCGNATRTKERTCSNPPPSKGGNQCSGPDEEIEERSLPECRSLNDTIQALQDAMQTLQAEMQSMQSIGTCMSDLSSSDCPGSAPGKVGVVDGISTNKAGVTSAKADINSNKAGISTNKAGVTSAKADINTNKAGINTNKAGISTNKAGVTSAKADINTNKAGISTNKAGISTNKAGVTSAKADINTNKDGISTNKAGVTSAKADINTNKAGISTNKAGISTNKAGVTSAKADINTNKAGINTNKAGINTNKAGISTNKAGVTSAKADINTNRAGISTNKAGISTNKAGVTSAKADINTNKAGISTNKAGVTSAKADINTNKAGINTNKADINTNKANIDTSNAAINTNKAGIMENKASIAAHHALLLHTDANYEYYKAPVPASSKMTSAVVLATCIKLGMKPQCFNSNNADSNCVQAPSTSFHHQHPTGMSQILCSTTWVPSCASLLNMFWYMKPSHALGYACGSTKDAGFCSAGKKYISTSDMPYFAACLKPVTTDWTIIQRRGQYGNAEDYFYKDFNDYENGFGSVDGELWIGLKKLVALTKDGEWEWELQVDLTDWDDKKYHAKYGTFSVGPAPTYTLHVGGFKDGESTLGDSMEGHDGQAFSARDKDVSSGGSCVVNYRGGWWYKNCYYANLNGLNFAEQKADNRGLVWYYGKSRGDSWVTTWKASVMKIKRVEV